MSELPKMNGITIAGTVYVLETDCRKTVNAVLQQTAAERDRLAARVKELEEALRQALYQTESKNGICTICGSDEQDAHAQWCPFALLTKSEPPADAAQEGE